MILYGLDAWITGHDGNDYWAGAEEEHEQRHDLSICGNCAMGAHEHCRMKLKDSNRECRCSQEGHR